MKLTFAFCFLLLIISFLSCKEEDTPTEFVVVPAGRSFLNGSDIKVSINNVAYQPTSVFDSCGGYWLRIPRGDLSGNELSIQYTRRKANLTLYKEPAINKHQWLSEATYIDSENEKLKAKALDLTKNYSGNLEKAKQLHTFVKQHMKFNIYRDAFLDKASKTYELGYGACMNYSRLYVAMCRAVGIPARSIWGVIYGYNNDNIYDYHHQWVEVLDENGYWHPADFDYTKNFDLNDIRYLDLIYAAEENTKLEHRSTEEVVTGTVNYFNNYPAALTGRLGFQLVEDKRPDYMIVKYVYKF